MDLTCFNWVQLIKKTDLPPNAKLLAFYLSTFMNAEQDIAWPSQSRISTETGLSKITVRKYLQILESGEWLIIRKKVHHVDTGNQSYLHNEYLINIPEQRVRSLLSDMSRGKAEREQRVNSEQPEGKELTPNNNRITKNNNKRFIPPSIEDVREYCQSRNNSIDPESFVSFYQSKGWKVGNTKMKDWKSAVITWEKRDEKDKRDNTGRAGRVTETLKQIAADDIRQNGATDILD